MRRPLCVFCAGMLGVALVCDFLPQTELFVPFAAFFVALCLLLCIFEKTRAAALCILLGAAAGMASVLYTENRPGWLPRDIPMPVWNKRWKNTPGRR